MGAGIGNGRPAQKTAKFHCLSSYPPAVTSSIADTFAGQPRLATTNTAARTLCFASATGTWPAHAARFLPSKCQSCAVCPTRPEAAFRRPRARRIDPQTAKLMTCGLQMSANCPPPDGLASAA